MLLYQGGDTQDEAQPPSGDKPTASSAPGTVQATEMFRVPPPTVDEGDMVSAKGSWLTDDHYVSGAPDALKAYHADTGKPAWTVPLSGNICQASRDVTHDGKVAVVFAAAKAPRSLCTQIAVVDITEGRKLWQRPLPQDAYLGLGLSVAISEDIAAAGWPGGSAGYRISTAKRLWDAPPRGCGGEEHLGRRQLLTMIGCSTASGPQFRVERRSPETGEATWKYTLPGGIVSAWIVSADPLVFAVRTNEEALDADRLLTVSSDGTVQATIDIGDDYVSGCDADNGVCGAITTTADTIYIASDPHSFYKGNAISAFDIRTGKRKWTSAAPDKRTVIPIHAEGESAIAYMKSRGSKGSTVLRLDPETGKQTTLMQMPFGFDRADAESSLVSDDMKNPAHYRDGLVFFHDGGNHFKDLVGSVMTLGYRRE
ncbi:PQQ-binding-like beta-propeller repeat protein [Streptomyces sp. NPDC056835]|uniref:outer membrane protein assembly factor BamB family protein n=1 Tax=Streptomyces sp. NPDC056835 TaxID=3345956 RepID=UPI0036B446BB